MIKLIGKLIQRVRKALKQPGPNPLAQAEEEVQEAKKTGEPGKLALAYLNHEILKAEIDPYTRAFYDFGRSLPPCLKHRFIMMPTALQMTELTLKCLQETPKHPNWDRYWEDDAKEMKRRIEAIKPPVMN
jgi:hypothetical protein